MFLAQGLAALGVGGGWDCLLSQDRPLNPRSKAYSFTDFIQGLEEQMFSKMHAQCGKNGVTGQLKKVQEQVWKGNLKPD